MYKAFQIHSFYFSNLIIYRVEKKRVLFSLFPILGIEPKQLFYQAIISRNFYRRATGNFLKLKVRLWEHTYLPQHLNKELNKTTNLKLEFYFLNIPCPWININQNRHTEIIIFIRIYCYRRNCRISRVIEFSDTNIVNRITNYTKLTQFIGS